MNCLDFNILKSFEVNDKNQINPNQKIIDQVLKKKEMVEFIE